MWCAGRSPKRKGCGNNKPLVCFCKFHWLGRSGSWKVFDSRWAEHWKEWKPKLRRSDHITDALASLHWLRIPERIQFKIAVLKFFMGLHCITWVRSSLCLIYRVGVVSALPAMIALLCYHLIFPLLAVEYFCCSDMERSARGHNSVTNVTHFS